MNQYAYTNNTMRPPPLAGMQVLKLFDRLDLNHDGKISWEEFSSFLQRSPEYLAVIMSAHPTLLRPKSPKSPNTPMFSS